MIIKSLGYQQASIAIAIVGGLLMLCPYFAKPDSYQPKVSEESSPRESIFSGVKKALKHKKFLAVSIVFVGAQMSLTIMTAAAPFIATSVLGGTERDVAFLMGPMLLTAFPSFFISNYLSKKFGWQKTILVAATVLMLLFAGTSHLLGEAIIGSALNTAMILFGLAGPMIAILLGLEGQAVTDCAGEKDSGSVSTYFGVINLLIKSFNGLALFATGVLSDLALGSLGNGAYRGMVFTAGASLFLALCTCFFLHKESPK